MLSGLTTKLLRVAMLVVALSTGHAAAGTVNRCVDPVTGKVTVTDHGCPVAVTKAPEPRPPVSIDPIDRKVDDRLLLRFPAAAAHNAAHLSDLENLTLDLRRSLHRWDALETKRKELNKEAEFHKGKPFPAVLQRDFEANEASFKGLAEVFAGTGCRIQSLDARFVAEHAHLSKLWAGAPSGSIGRYEEPLEPACSRSR